jgi:hypothetical protein
VGQQVIMKTVLALSFALGTLAFSTLAFADGNGITGEEATPAKRVASVSWNTESGKLEWVVQSGFIRNEDFVPSGEETRYEITPEEAMMAFQGQQRGFTDQEAAWLQGLLHVLTVYCAESTVWWDQGQGVPLDHGKPAGEPPADKSPDPDTAPHKVTNPPQRRTPGSVRLVAVQMIQ